MSSEEWTAVIDAYRKHADSTGRIPQSPPSNRCAASIGAAGAVLAPSWTPKDTTVLPSTRPCASFRQKGSRFCYSHRALNSEAEKAAIAIARAQREIIRAREKI